MAMVVKKYSCKVCVKTGAMDRRFKEKSHCFQHYIACHYSKGEDTAYVQSDSTMCPKCSRVLKSIVGLMQHRTNQHSEDPGDDNGPWVIHGSPRIKAAGQSKKSRKNKKKQSTGFSGVSKVFSQLTISKSPSSDYFNKPVFQYGSTSVGAVSFSIPSGSMRQGAMADSSTMEDSFLKMCTNLNSFLETTIIPSTEENTILGRAMDALAIFLKEQLPSSVKEVEKGGSAGKGTVVKDKSDLDVVVLMNDFKDMSDFEKTIRNVTSNLENVFEKQGIRGGHKVTVDGTTKFATKIKLTPANMDRAIDIDVLPAYDNLGIHGKPRTYQNMQKSSRREFYSSSLVKLQVDFTKSKPAAVKNLIRLVKYWRKTHFQERSEMRNSLPTSYPLELLTIHCWENAGSPERFDMAQGLKAVFQALVNFKRIKCKWETNYRLCDYQEEIRKLELAAVGMLKPLILDPANPFNNTADRAGAWQEVADMAEDGLRSTCLKDIQIKARWHAQ